MNQQEFILMMKSLTIVYIEDELDIRNYIAEFLRRYCKEVHEAGTAEEGYELYKKYNPSIMIVDINLPKMSGLDLVTQIRKDDKKTRIIISTAYTDQDFILKAVELNLTRYLVKPVTSKEIMDVLKKSIEELEEQTSGYSTIDLGEGFLYDMKKMTLIHDDKTVELRKKEKQLLDFFIKKGNEVVSYEEIETKVWQDSNMSSDAIRSQIRNLRKKTFPTIIKNISGIGYKLNSI